MLDKIWDENTRMHCLEQGDWNFATRSAELEYDPSLATPDFGFQYGFTKPTDWVRTIALASDENFNNPLTDKDYVDESGLWWSHFTIMYIRYVSSDSNYGYDLSLWPQTFVRYVESYMAEMMAPRLSLSQDRIERLTKNSLRKLTDAKSKDARNEGVKFPPETSWVRARRGGGGGSRGSRSSLTG